MASCPTLIKYINRMLRRKKPTILQAYIEPNSPTQLRQASHTFIPENPLSGKLDQHNNPDSLQRFQWEL